MAELLVSVRSAAEAVAALAGGAHLIDVKEPQRGPLGRAADAVRVDVVRTVARRRPVSAALGELLEGAVPPGLAGLSYVKWGLAGCQGVNWRERLAEVAAMLAATEPGCQAVAAAYADWQRAQAPPPSEVAAFARARHWPVLLLDTFAKDGTTLLDWLPLKELAALHEECRGGGIRVALAGSLGLPQIDQLRGLAPDWFAVRGAACRDGQRGGCIDAERVRRLVELLGVVAAALE